MMEHASIGGEASGVQVTTRPDINPHGAGFGGGVGYSGVEARAPGVLKQFQPAPVDME